MDEELVINFIEIPAEFFDKSQISFLTRFFEARGSLSYGESFNERLIELPSIKKDSIPKNFMP